MTLHIHAPQPTEKRIVRTECPTCERRTYFVDFFTPYYGWVMTCLKCGDKWEDGERLPRPFKPRWRAESKARAKARYRRVT